MSVIRLLLIAAMFLVNSGAMFVLERRFSPTVVTLPDQILHHRIPVTLGPWLGEEASLDPELFRAAGAVEMVNRFYRNPMAESVALSVGIWSEETTWVPHSPVRCYSAAGWTLLDQRDIELNISRDNTDEPWRARLLSYMRDEQRSMVLFWCHIGDRIFLDHRGMRGFRIALRTGAVAVRPVIKVTLTTSSSATDDSRAEGRLSELAELVFPRTYKVATGD